MDETQLTGCQDLLNWLKIQGFKLYLDENRFRGEQGCNWYACRRTLLPARECETNEGKGIQIVVIPYSHCSWESIEIEVCGEAKGIWWNFKAYSLTIKEFQNRLPEIETSLIAAWNALTR